MKTYFTMSLLLLTALVLMGCATTAKVTQGTLEAIGIAENGAMRVAATAEAKHQITDAQWQQDCRCSRQVSTRLRCRLQWRSRGMGPSLGACQRDGSAPRAMS